MKKIIMYGSKDGTLHTTEVQAMSNDRYVDMVNGLKTIVHLEYFSAMTQTDMCDMLIEHSEELFNTLRIYHDNEGGWK